MKKILKRVLVGSMLLGSALLAQADTGLVVNGDFETGDLSGWVESGNLAGGFVFQIPNNPVNSTNLLGIIAVDTPYFISQNLATQVGGNYNLSFDLQVQGIAPSSGGVTFEAYFGGQKVFGVVDQTLEFTHFSFNNLHGTGNLTELKLGGRNDPDFTLLDNISVTAVPVPEPETWGMLLAGLGLLAWRRRARKG